MPLRKDIKKVMVIGSGPIVIGQAAEFDYAGTQACRALKEEGIEVVLVNSNPATIMTDTDIADRVYLEPLIPEVIAQILRKEKPDGIIANLGGQVGLNAALALHRQGVLEETGVPLLGTPITAIEKAEDRQVFKMTLEEIGEPVPESGVVQGVGDALELGRKIGYPLIVRPAYTLGGTGGGTACNEAELERIVSRGLKASPIRQVLIEKSLLGFKEIEFEVMRDSQDNCITVCSMENIDPMGVHTGDSMVVAPALTLNDAEYQMLRNASLKIIRALGIEGGCNIQFALNPNSPQYYVIEVNPRVSRSSALASKATGYPIARVATKIAIGYRLDEIPNRITGKTASCFEPAIDYVVIKIPRWPFDKFSNGNRTLGTQMKATGEVMAIDRTFEAALLKGVRSLEQGVYGLIMPELFTLDDEALKSRLKQADDQRLFIIAEALRRGFTVEEIAGLSGINSFFIRKIRSIVEMSRALQVNGLPVDILWRAKRMGFADREIASLTNTAETEVRSLRRKNGIVPAYKMVDTCAAEFEAATPYYYSCYDEEDEVNSDPGKRKIMVIGSGPIRIGQGIEFDYCSVHCVWALREAGFQAVIVNNNPETVSTDFDVSDRLYFEPLAWEDVMNVIEKERPEGVIVQFGGQTAINLARPLAVAGVKILGTDFEGIDKAENRDRFDALLNSLGIPRPPGGTATSTKKALEVAERIGYPVLVRPSYVLGGRAMEIVYNSGEASDIISRAFEVFLDCPVLIDKYLEGVELEVDALSDGEDVVIPAIMQHVERAGVHSGDSIAVYPPFQLSEDIKKKIQSYTEKLAKSLQVKGLLNIQFVVFENELYVLEVNPRASRTVPYVSKVTGIPMVKLATDVILGKKLKQLGYENGLLPARPYYAIKAPVFSFGKLSEIDVAVGPEMKSTGEVVGIDTCFDKALYKALISSGIWVPDKGTVLVTIADKDKREAVPIIRGFYDIGFEIIATAGTAETLNAARVRVTRVSKLSEGHPNVVDLIRDDRVDLVINTIGNGKKPLGDGFQIRRAAVEMGVPCLTSLDTARAVLDVVRDLRKGRDFQIKSLQEYCAGELASC